MQSGRAKTKRWILEYRAETARIPEPLMGWVSAGDTTNQVRIPFDSRAEAVAFAKKHGFAYTVVEPQERRPRPQAYADNFTVDRTFSWTHCLSAGERKSVVSGKSGYVRVDPGVLRILKKKTRDNQTKYK